MRGPCAAAILMLAMAGRAHADATGKPVDAWVHKHLAAGDVAAAAVADIRADAIDARGFGRRSPSDAAVPDADTQFQYGSVTKVFTHLLLAELDAAGVARYGQTVGALMPDDFEPRNAAVATITLQALATHTSGLPRLPASVPLDNADPYARYDARDLRKDVAAARHKQPLGRFYTYSNFGVGLLGHLLGKAEGDGYAHAVTARVIAPLGLQHTGLEPGSNAAVAISGGKPVKAWGFTDALAGAGSLWGSVSDLGLLVQAWFDAHEHALRHDLARDLEIAVHDAGSFSVTRVWHVARAGEHPIYWHNGGTTGFHSFVGFRPDQKRGVAILVSGDADPTAVGLGALGFTTPAPRVATHDASIFGQYQLTPQFGMGVFEQDGALVTQATGQPAFALHSVGDDWYALGDVDASLHFRRDDGTVTALELAQNGVVQKAARTAGVATAAARTEIELDGAALSEYVGAYAFAPEAVLTIKRAGDGLQAQLTGQPYFPIYARATDQFFYKVVDAELAFERNGDGAVKAVVLHQGGVEQRARRLR